MSKLSSFVLTVQRGVAVGAAVAAGAAIIPCGSTYAALDRGSSASITSVPRGATVSYDGDDDVSSGVTDRKLFDLSIAGSNYFGFSGDGLQLGPPITGSGSSPGDVFIDINLVGIEWLMPWTRSSPRSGPPPLAELPPD